MNAVLDFPTLHAEPPAVEKTNAIAAGIASVQGEVAKFDQIAAGLKAIEDAHPKNVIVAAIDTPPGMRQAETSWRAYRNPRLEVERARKAAKAPVLALGKAIDAFAGTLEERLREGEDHYRSQIDAEDARRAAIKAEQERIEREAAERHAARRAAISMYALRCQEPGMTADRIALGIGRLEDADMSDPDNARAVELADMQCRTLETMWTLHAQALAREQEAARQEANRIENERVAAELAAERARIAAEAEAVRRAAAELAAREQAAREAEQRQRDEAAAAELLRQAQALLHKKFTEAPEPTGEGKAGTPGAGNAEAAPIIYSHTPGPAPVFTDSADFGVVAIDAAPAVGFTGTPDGHLLQDMNSGLSQALSSNPDAMQHAREAAHTIAQERKQREYPLPDSLYPGSKDWMQADYAARVEWLHAMYEVSKKLLSDATGEIDRLRVIEYEFESISRGDGKAILCSSDCRLCAHFTTQTGGCTSLVQCVDSMQFKETPPRTYWISGHTALETGGQRT